MISDRDKNIIFRMFGWEHLFLVVNDYLAANATIYVK